MKATKSRYAQDIKGKSFVIIGEMVRWPAALGSNPVTAIEKRGGKIEKKLSKTTDYLVLSPKRAGGKAAAHRKAQDLNDKGAKIEVIDDAGLAHVLRPRLDSASFYIFGAFDCAPGGDGPTHPRQLVQTVGGVVHDTPTEDTQFAVIGGRRAAGKADVERLIAPFVESGSITPLTEQAFLELVALHRPPNKDDGISGLFVRLQTLFDPGKLQRALKMLQKQRLHLFADVAPDRIMGIVQSQTSEDVYASHLSAEGEFACRMMSLEPCMGLGGPTGTCKACKHLLVLVLGLVNEGLLKCADAEQWLVKAATKNVSRNTEIAAEAILKYKGVQAGEVDWRPIETVPEDYYSL